MRCPIIITPLKAADLIYITVQSVNFILFYCWEFNFLLMIKSI